MRKFNNYEAVKVNNAEEAMEFLQYLEDNTDLKWCRKGKKPTDINKEALNNQEFPIFFEVRGVTLWAVKSEDKLEAKNKIIPLSEFL